MKAIKKVEVVPLDYNEGKIINSWNTTDDKTKNAPSMKIVEDKIVDTWSTTEDKTKIAPSMHLVDNKFNFFQNAITLNNQALNNFINSFAVLSGTTTSYYDQTAEADIDFPDGFDKNNSVLISASIESSGDPHYGKIGYYSWTSGTHSIDDYMVNLQCNPEVYFYTNAQNEDKINIAVRGLNSSYNYKIVIMKIS